MIWSFLAGMACMFALMCVLSVWAGLHLAKKVEQRPYKHLVTALQEQDEKRQSVASASCGASAENTRAGAQPAATTAYARPLGATPVTFVRLVVWDQNRRYILGSVSGRNNLWAHDAAMQRFGDLCCVQKWEFSEPEERLIADVMDSAREAGVE